MIKIGFIAEHDKDWMGGIHYYKNLLHAISTLKDTEITPIIFVGKKTDSYIIDCFKPYATIIEDSMFDRNSFKWIISRIFSRFLDSPYILNKLITKYNINIFSHLNTPISSLNCKSICWIPDFQHLHLPDMFSVEEIKKRDLMFANLIKKSDGVLVSSHDAYNDCIKFSPTSAEKVHVLQFVSQPSNKSLPNTIIQTDLINKKYQLPEKYFYLPNQFWKHKNHIQVFRSVSNLKEKGIDVSIVCSGSLNDYRNQHHIGHLKLFIKEHELENNIKLLGMIDYNDVLYLMRHSIAVINPSLFEGWSSTVEECKSIGKNMVLSNINVHREQNPPESLFFDLSDDASLFGILENLWVSGNAIPNIDLEEKAASQLQKRTHDFATTYLEIIKRVIYA